MGEYDITIRVNSANLGKVLDGLPRGISPQINRLMDRDQSPQLLALPSPKRKKTGLKPNTDPTSQRSRIKEFCRTSPKTMDEIIEAMKPTPERNTIASVNNLKSQGIVTRNKDGKFRYRGPAIKAAAVAPPTPVPQGSTRDAIRGVLTGPRNMAQIVEALHREGYEPQAVKKAVYNMTSVGALERNADNEFQIPAAEGAEAP